MLVRLLLLRRLSPALFWFKITGIIAFVIVFLALAAECGFLLLRGLNRVPAHPPAHTTEPR
jgi:hypothetical protein